MYMGAYSRNRKKGVCAYYVGALARNFTLIAITTNFGKVLRTKAIRGQNLFKGVHNSEYTQIHIVWAWPVGVDCAPALAGL